MRMQARTEKSGGPRTAQRVSKRNLLKLTGAAVAALGMTLVLSIPLANAQDMSNGAANFYTSDRVTVQKVTFKNQSVVSQRYSNKFIWLALAARSDCSGLRVSS